jgi:hypothetical protein
MINMPLCKCLLAALSVLSCVDAVAPSTQMCRPLLYVYELPDSYRHENKPDGRSFGVPVASPFGMPTTAALFSAATYGTGAAFFEATLNYRCRTWMPAEADLFFVPTFTTSFGTARRCVDAVPGHPKNCSRDALFRRLHAVRSGSGVSYLDARGGADHILLTGHQGFWFDLNPSYEVSYRDRRLRGAMLFSVEEGAAYPWPGPSTRFDIHSTPWSSMVHVAASTPRVQLPWRSTHRRAVLVAGAFATRRAVGPASKQFNNLRRALHRACLQRADRCEYASPGASTPVKSNDGIYGAAHVLEIHHEKYSHGVFSGALSLVPAVSSAQLCLDATRTKCHGPHSTCTIHYI